MRNTARQEIHLKTKKNNNKKENWPTFFSRKSVTAFFFYLTKSCTNWLRYTQVYDKYVLWCGKMMCIKIFAYNFYQHNAGSEQWQDLAMKYWVRTMVGPCCKILSQNSGRTLLWNIEWEQWQKLCVKHRVRTVAEPLCETRTHTTAH